MSILLWPEGASLSLGNTTEDNPSLTPYLVSSEERVSAMIVCPGGGYQFRSDYEGEPVAQWLNSVGISAFVLNYRVAPYQFPCQLLDVQRAIRMVRFYADEWKINVDKIGILGFSAGGHLSAMAGTLFDKGNQDSDDPIERLSSRPDLTVLCYPVISFFEHRHNGSMNNLIGHDRLDELIPKLSLENQVTKETPPAFIWHTADDAAVPAENSMLFAQSMSREHIPFELHVFDQGEHGLGLAENHESAGLWTKLCENWLRKQAFC